MKEWRDRYRAWRKAKTLAREKRLFEKLLADPKSGVPAMVDALTNLKAVTMVKQFMDAKGYARCQFCLKTDQLRRYGQGYICPDHLEERKKIENAAVKAMVSNTENASYIT